MMSHNLLLIILILSLLYSCGTKKRIGNKQEPLDKESSVYILNENDTIPKDATHIGKIKVEHGLYWINCDFQIVVELAKKRARKLGGNIAKITRYKPYEFYESSCYKLKADVFKTNNHQKNINNTFSVKRKNYAVLNFYRYHAKFSPLECNIYLGDSLIAHIKENFKKSIKIKKEGKYILKTDNGIEEIPININLGKSYYIKASPKGRFFNRSILTIQLMENEQGKKEYDLFVNNDW